MVKSKAGPAGAPTRAPTRAPTGARAGALRDHADSILRHRPGTRLARKLVGSRKNRLAFLELLARHGDPAVAADALGLPLLVLLRHRDADPAFAADWQAAVNYAWELLESRMLAAMLNQSAEGGNGQIDTRLALAIVGRREKPVQTVKARPVDGPSVARLRAELRALAEPTVTRN